MYISHIANGIESRGTWSSNGMHIEYCDNYYNDAGKKVRGYIGWCDEVPGVEVLAETIEEVLEELIEL